MFGKPKRNTKCGSCGQTGRCSCARRTNAALAHDPAALAHCTRMCGWQRGKPCGRMARGGVCPCPNC